MFQSTSDYMYVPYYITIFMLFLGLVYCALLVHTIIHNKYTFVGKLLLGCSIVTLLFIGFYCTDNGFYVDFIPSSERIFPVIGFVELVFTPFPYIFLILANQLGKK